MDESEETLLMSIPEPPPKDCGVAVTPLLCDWINGLETDHHITQQVKVRMRDLIMARHNYGMDKYGQPLKTEDGRDSVEDGRQELGDLMQYLFKAKMNGEDIAPIMELIPFLLKLLQQDVE
jgi:hypothetical protein